MAILDELVAILGFDLRGTQDAKRYQATLNRIDKKMDGLAQRSVGVGRALTGFMVAIGAANVVEGAAKYEEAIADIAKVVEATPAQIEELSDSLLAMSRRVPVAADGLAAISAEAGAAGIALEDLEQFTEQVAVAVVAFEVPAARVGEIMAKLGNQFKFTTDDMGHFNDTVNHLSNNMAAKAGEILNFTNRASGAAAFLGLTADQLAGAGAALIAAGVVPETAARGFNALATRIQTDVKGIDEELHNIGLTNAELKRMLAEDGDAALVELFERLSTLPIEDQAHALKRLVGQDFSDDFSKLVNNPELLKEAMAFANDEAGKLGSAMKEYNARADTSIAKWQRMKGIFKSVLISGVDPLLEGFKAFADVVFAVQEYMDGILTATEAVQAAAAALGFDIDAGRAAEIAEQIRQSIAGISAAAAGVVDTLRTVVNFVASEFAPRIMDHWQRVVDSLSRFDISGFQALIDGGGALEGVIAAAAAGVSGLGELFTAFSVAATTALDVVVGALSDFSDGSTFAAFSERLGALGDTVGRVFDRIAGLFGPGSAGASIAETIGQIVGEIAVLFGELIGNRLLTIAEIAVAAIDGIVSALDRLLQGDYVGALSALSDGARNAVSALYEGIGAALLSVVDAFERVTGLDLSAWTGRIQTVIANSVEIIGSFFDTLKSRLEGIASGDTFAGFGERISAIGASLGETFDNIGVALDKLFALFSDGGSGASLAATLGSLAANLLVLFGEVMGGAVLAAIEMVVSVINTLSEALRALMAGDILGAFEALLQGIVDLVGIADGFVSGILSAVDNFVKSMTGLSIAEVFNNLVESAKNAAIAIKDALVDGVKGLGSAIGNAILSAIEGALNSAVAKVNSVIDTINDNLGGVGVSLDRIDEFKLTDDTEAEKETRASAETGFAETPGDTPLAPGQAVDRDVSTDAAPEGFETAPAGASGEDLAAIRERNFARLRKQRQEREAARAIAAGEMPRPLDAVAEPVAPTPAPVRANPRTGLAAKPVPIETAEPIQTTPAPELGPTSSVASMQGATDALINLASAANAAADIGATAPEQLEQTVNNDNTRNITNNVTNNTTINQTVTGTTAPGEAARATERAAQRGTDRGLTASNIGAAD